MEVIELLIISEVVWGGGVGGIWVRWYYGSRSIKVLWAGHYAVRDPCCWLGGLVSSSLFVCLSLCLPFSLVAYKQGVNFCQTSGGYRSWIIFSAKFSVKNSFESQSLRSYYFGI